MSSTEIVALAAAAVTLIAALAAAVVSIITALRVSPLAVKVDGVVEKVAVVHDLVNGLAHEKDAAIAQGAQRQGELIGRDFEAAKRADTTAAMQAQIDANTAARAPQAVTIVGTETTIPATIEEDKK